MHDFDLTMDSDEANETSMIVDSPSPKEALPIVQQTKVTVHRPLPRAKIPVEGFLNKTLIEAAVAWYIDDNRNAQFSYANDKQRDVGRAKAVMASFDSFMGKDLKKQVHDSVLDMHITDPSYQKKREDITKILSAVTDQFLTTISEEEKKIAIINGVKMRMKYNTVSALEGRLKVTKNAFKDNEKHQLVLDFGTRKGSTRKGSRKTTSPPVTIGSTKTNSPQSHTSSIVSMITSTTSASQGTTSSSTVDFSLLLLGKYIQMDDNGNCLWLSGFFSKCGLLPNDVQIGHLLRKTHQCMSTIADIAIHPITGLTMRATIEGRLAQQTILVRAVQGRNASGQESILMFEDMLESQNCEAQYWKGVSYDELLQLLLHPKNCYPDIGIIGECLATVLDMVLVVKSVTDPSFDITTADSFDLRPEVSSGFLVVFQPYTMQWAPEVGDSASINTGKFKKYGFLLHSGNNHFDVFVPTTEVTMLPSSLF